MKLFALLLISCSALPAFADCDEQVGELNALTQKFLGYKWNKADVESGNATVTNDLDSRAADFKALKKSSECRTPVFRALVLADIAALPFDQENIGAQLVGGVIAKSPELESEYKDVVAEFARKHQGERAMSCRASVFKDNVTAQTCQRAHPKKDDCFAKLVDYAACADLPEL